MDATPDMKHILINKGVTISNPETVVIEKDINPDRISSNNVVLHSGTRLSGSKTLILQGSVIGSEGTAVIENCYIGPNVKLGGGYFKDSVFLKNVAFGSCAHVREGCILEEESGAAHCVGLKQTILFPYVTLGSLINFCDCFMAGGTGKKNHSEVGSSYIHFNFTPQQDKATASLIGDVPRGVMIDQRPIFLGGQGGLVGPCRLGFGITVAAGTILRKDELRSNRLIFGGKGKDGNVSYSPGINRDIKRLVINNVIYIGNLFALRQWILTVRNQFVSNDFPTELSEGLGDVLKIAINERIKRLREFVKKVSDSLDQRMKRNRDSAESGILNRQTELVSQWSQVEEIIQASMHFEGNLRCRDDFMEAVNKGIREIGTDYLEVIAHLELDAKKIGISWLQEIVDQLVSSVTTIAPSMATSGK